MVAGTKRLAVVMSFPLSMWLNLLESMDVLMAMALATRQTSEERQMVYGIAFSILDCSKKRAQYENDERELNILYNRLLGSLLVLRSLLYEKH